MTDSFFWTCGALKNGKAVKNKTKGTPQSHSVTNVAVLPHEIVPEMSHMWHNRAGLHNLRMNAPQNYKGAAGAGEKSTLFCGRLQDAAVEWGESGDGGFVRSSSSAHAGKIRKP